MESVAQYLLGVVATAILCSVIGCLCDKSAFTSVMGMIIGVVMLLAVFKPLINLRFADLTLDYPFVSMQGEEIIAYSSDLAQKEISKRISEKLNAYIEEKASCWGADIEAQTDIKNSVPDSITIIGEVSPYVRAQLASWIESEIGIGREAVLWR